MSWFEPAALLLALGVVLARFVAVRAVPYLLAGSALALIAALAVNPERWQLYPAVIGLALVALAARRRRLATLSLATGAVLLTLSFVLAQVLFAMPHLPPPSAPVGTVSLTLVRPTEDGPRRLFVKLWYPAGASRNDVDGLWSDLQQMPDVPWFMRFGVAYLAKTDTNSRSYAPYAQRDGPARVVLYNHSFVSFASENSLLAEALAGRGNVVIAIRHIGQVDEYEALDGRQDPRAVATEIIRRRTADSRFVADRLGQVLKAIPRYDRAPPQDYAAIGFSLGGEVSTRLCVEDKRCRAVANLDGAIPGVDYSRIGVPHYLMIRGKSAVGSSPAGKAGAGYEERIFPKAAHADFHDAAVALPVMRWVFGRSVEEVERERREVAETIVDFLDRP